MFKATEHSVTPIETKATYCSEPKLNSIYFQISALNKESNFSIQVI